MTDDKSPKKRRRRRRRKQDGGEGSDADSSRRREGTKDSGPGRKGPRPSGGGDKKGPGRKRRRRRATGVDQRDDDNKPNESPRQPPVALAPEMPASAEAASPLRIESASDSFVPDDEDGEVAPIAALEPAYPATRDPDPSTEESAASFKPEAVADVVGVKFRGSGKTFLFDSGALWLERGEQVVVDSESGPRLATVSLATDRRAHKQRRLKRVLRRPSEEDLERQSRSESRNAEVLATTRAIAGRLELPIKVYRCEVSGRGDKVTVFFSSDEKVNAKPLVHDLARELSCRIDTRQTGVRDAAKSIGGIGSCGEELCCTRWLPSFVPVSIKHAKDQGLALNPQKISGQCGRLKCCLVYEHAAYAELRKGLPRLGKRVVTQDGEGRVVEVDVLRQRVRVSLQGGDNKIYSAGEVEPLFPSQNQNPQKQ